MGAENKLAREKAKASLFIAEPKNYWVLLSGNPHMPSIRTLQTFLTTARLGSFAAAGQEIGLTSAAVSLQIRTLEQELGVNLFD
ncbi:MAG: LysR family transcriptional regulator, partial [Betaproteobacteria bacterium]